MAGVLAIKGLGVAVASAAVYALGYRRLAIWFGVVALAKGAMAAADRDAAMRVRNQR